MQLNVISETEQRAGRRHPPNVDADALEHDLRRSIDGEVKFDTTYRSLYSTDASNYRQVPIGVVIPRTAEDVVEIISLCRRYGAPMVSRGGGTSLAGQCCNVAVVLDCSKHLNRILNVDPEGRTARVQPGVIHDQLTDQTEAEHKLTFGPDTSTHAWATFGGMIGNNSCGVHSVMAAPASRTSDSIEEMEVLTYDGLRLRVGATSEEELHHIIQQGGRRGEIYRGMKNIRDRYADLIRQRYPDIPRRVSGYNLDELLPENGFHVARALAGTEGTCATILEATVRLIPSPPKRSLLVLGYENVYSAGDHVPQVMGYGPTGLEGMDDELLAYMNRKGMKPEDVNLLPEGGGWLIAEFGGDTVEEANDKARRLMEDLKQADPPPSMRLFDNPERIQRIWEVRESGLGATANVPGLHNTWPGWEDAAVPPEQLGQYLREFRELIHEHGYRCSLYGHFGQGCVHCRINFDLTTHNGIDQYLRFIDDASDLVLRYGGSMSGEHGDGQARATVMPKMYGAELMEAMRQFKSVWDPQWKMNPGKVIDSDPPEANLRLGTDYRPRNPDTHFHFPEDDGSFADASLRCVGVGKCRRRSDAFMCPSFVATHDEKDTTRGRARVLFEMMRGDFDTSGWKSEAVKESLDLCLACKGCKKECPVNVDMATYKSEFLSHYYERRLHPPDAYAMGLIDWWAKMASWAPGLANLVGQTPPLSSALKKIGGISPRRPLPAFARQTFTEWFHQHGRRDSVGSPVMLYPDVFNNHFYPGTLRAAAGVLDRLGYSVLVPPNAPPAIRPLIHYGMLDTAKRRIRRAIRQLAPFAAEGVPIVGLEPSTVAVFRDEVPNLLPHDQDGRRLKKNVHLLSEFLDRQNADLPTLQRRAILHNHCHQKAVLETDAMGRILEAMGVKAEQPEPGCCGMAGSFGFEAKHYDISMEIGEQNLLPAVRSAAPDTLMLADGFSCREQIRGATGRLPMHLSELLLMAFEEGPTGPRRDYPEVEYAGTDAPSLKPTITAMIAAAAVSGFATATWLKRKSK